VPVLAVDDEIVVECDEQHAEAVKEWLERCMKDGMASMLGEEPRIESAIRKSWADDQVEDVAIQLVCEERERELLAAG
jgi:hypothetical protein